MRLFIKLFFIVAILINAYAQDCKSKLIITTEFQPMIFINDSLISNSDKTEIELPDGFYKITVKENTILYNSEVIIDSVNLLNCSVIEKKYSSVKKIFLDSNPQDAAVFHNDSLIGYTPILIKNDYEELIIKKQGYFNYELNIDDYKNKIFVNLISLGQTSEQQKFFNTTLFKVLSGTAIALGAVTAYYKLKADDKFDEYKRSRNKQLLDETNRYDTISGITFAAMQINLGFLLYRLLSE